MKTWDEVKKAKLTEAQQADSLEWAKQESARIDASSDPHGYTVNRIFDQARAVFDAWPDKPGDPLPNNPACALQIELMRWQVRNFGAAQAVHLALGIGEEVGELCEALTKPNKEREHLMGDALADITIFGFNLATVLRLDFGELQGIFHEMVVKDTNVQPLFHKLVIASGQLQHAVLKNAQGIRGMDDEHAYRRAAGDALSRVGFHTRRIAILEGFDFWSLVETTAREVMKRDWTVGK